LPQIYADPDLNKQRLGELIDLIGTIGFNQDGHTSKDLLGRVYEYLLGQFVDSEGKKGGQFYTPASIVKVLVEMLEPYQGRVYDGCCGSGGMFVQSEKFVLSHQGNIIGSMVNRRNRELTDDDLAPIAGTYHSWRSKDGGYEDKVGFCKAATIEEVRNNNHVLMPGRYVGTEEEIDDGVPFEEKMNALTAKLAEQFAKGAELEKTIRENLKGIGYGF
jgi:type I restriction-modification system DNA methylase subunit